MERIKLRDIVEDERFKEELSILSTDVHRAEEFIEGAKWLLARSYTYGTEISHDPPLLFLTMNDPLTSSAMTLFYSFTDTTIIFLSVSRTDLLRRQL